MPKGKKTKKLISQSKSSKDSNVVATPKKKVAKKTSKKIEKIDPKLSKKLTNQSFYDQLKLGDSYVSLILGAAVVIGVFVIFLAYVKESRNVVSAEKVLHSVTGPTPIKAAGKEYVMQDGESLWDLAVRFYGDGFAYPKIVEANKNVITNPDYVPPGTKIIIPNAQ